MKFIVEPSPSYGEYLLRSNLPPLAKVVGILMERACPALGYGEYDADVYTKCLGLDKTTLAAARKCLSNAGFLTHSRRGSSYGGEQLFTYTLSVPPSAHSETFHEGRSGLIECPKSLEEAWELARKTVKQVAKEDG